MSAEPQKVEFIDDPDDFCRHCSGKGKESYLTERGTICTESCYHCGGTGRRSIRVGLPAL